MPLSLDTTHEERGLLTGQNGDLELAASGDSLWPRTPGSCWISCPYVTAVGPFGPSRGLIMCPIPSEVSPAETRTGLTRRVPYRTLDRKELLIRMSWSS
jgi:hypothetical protein